MIQSTSTVTGHRSFICSPGGTGEITTLSGRFTSLELFGIVRSDPIAINEARFDFYNQTKIGEIITIVEKTLLLSGIPKSIIYLRFHIHILTTKNSRAH